MGTFGDPATGPSSGWKQTGIDPMTGEPTSNWRSKPDPVTGSPSGYFATPEQLAEEAGTQEPEVETEPETEPETESDTSSSGPSGFKSSGKINIGGISELQRDKSAIGKRVLRRPV